MNSMYKPEKKGIAVVAISVFLFYLAGCSSIYYRRNYYGTLPGIYPAVRDGIAELSRGSGDWMGILPEWFYDAATVIGLPFSFVLDTLCLPYDVFKNKEKSIKIFSASFDRVDTVYFAVRNNTDRKLQAKVFIRVKEAPWGSYRTKTVGTKTIDIILLPGASRVIKENIECNIATTEGKRFRAYVSIRSYKEVE